MLIFLKAASLQSRGMNLNAKNRRNSPHIKDVLLAHIGGTDKCARTLLIANKFRISSHYERLRTERYSPFDSGKDAKYENYTR